MTSSKPSKKHTRKKTKPTILLGGLAGSGKSTTAKVLMKRFGIRHVSAGDMSRRIAKKLGMNLIELGRYRKTHPELDKKLDNLLMKEARAGGVVIDGRTLGYLSKKRRIPALKIWLSVKPKLSAERCAKRDGITVRQAYLKNKKREDETARRLKALWGLDISDTSYYDAVIQTDDYSPKEVAELIAQLVNYGRD